MWFIIQLTSVLLIIVSIVFSIGYWLHELIKKIGDKK